MTATAATVYIVDDDPQVCESLSLMICSAGLNVETFSSAEEFLAKKPDLPNTPKCLILDVRMPGLSGLGLQQMLVSKGKRVPIIMISGCADIPMAVQAMNAGAMDFLEKPFNRGALLTRIQEAIDRDATWQQHKAHSFDIHSRLGRLSSRQHDVFKLLVAGKHSKQIANELRIGEKTVAKHRACVLEKMQVDSVVELVRLVSEAEQA
jgi:FixJ family two-component response regulator